jgi:hypothetical protein
MEVIRIQRWIRGCFVRLRLLPLVMYKIRDYLKVCMINFSFCNEDGRINSCADEDEIIKILISGFGDKIKRPRMRMWYDILVYDYTYKWLPVNIKTTTMTTCDNTGGIAMCVYAYTDEVLDTSRVYKNGHMSNVLIDKLMSGCINKKNKKDYYFLVLNKNNGDVIVNSVKGLSVLTPNINNLPFQICWCKNREFEYGSIYKKLDLFLRCLQKPRPSWKEVFMSRIRQLAI